MVIWKEPAMNESIFAWYTNTRADDEAEQPFEKIVFLDIEGVLNCEETTYETGVKIDKDKVFLLKHIVEETGADIVLSSSWKIGYKKFVNAGYQSKNKDFGIFHDAMTEVGLKVSGITPIS